MFKVSGKAIRMVRELFKEREEISPIRIMVSGSGCCGPSFGMALDEPQEDEEVFDYH